MAVQCCEEMTVQFLNEADGHWMLEKRVKWNVNVTGLVCFVDSAFGVYNPGREKR